MGEHPMYRSSRGPGHLQTQSQPGAQQYRVRRGEDPLAELARLIGQEDPFAEFDLKPRRAPSNGNGGAKPVMAEPRYSNGNGDAYANGRTNGHANGHAAQARGNGHDVSRQSSGRMPTPVRSQPVRAEERLDRQPVDRQTRMPARTNGAAHAYQEQPRAPQPRPSSGRYADHHDQPVEECPEEIRDARHLARDRNAPRDRYVPDEAPRHARPRRRTQPDFRDQRTYEEGYDPQYDDAYAHENHDAYEMPRQGRGWGFWIVAAILVASLIAVAILGMFAYRTIFNAPPRAAVITKSNAPTKVEPQQSVAAPNKTIQDRIAGAPDHTQTLRREEQPIDLTTQQGPQLAPQQQQQKNVPAFTPPPQQQPVSEQGPKKVKTMTVRSDGTVVGNQQQAPQNNAPLQLNANPQAAEQELPIQNRPNSNLQPQNRTVASLGPTPTPQQQTTTASGNYIVQVASHKTQEEAQNAWATLKQQYASIFGNRNADIRKVDLGDRGTFYRAMVGPMNRDQANALCQNLKTAGAGCIVQTRN